MESIPIRKIAIFRALQFGDVLCSIPAIKSVRMTFPRAEITFIGLPWAHHFVERFPKYLNGFISFPGYPGLPEQSIEPKNIIPFLQQVQKKQFDLVIQMHGNGGITNPLVMLFGAKRQAGFYLEGMYKPSPHFFPYPKNVHEIHTWLQLCSQLSFKPVPDQLEFPVSKDEEKEVELLKKKHNIFRSRFVCIHPGARDPKRRGDPRMFAAVADSLYDEGYAILVTGSQKEKPIARQVVAEMKHPAHDLTGQTATGVLAALLKESQLLVSNDTGISHLAVGVKTPSIVVFMETESNRWVPLDTQRHRIVDGHSTSIVRDVHKELQFMKLQV